MSGVAEEVEKGTIDISRTHKNLLHRLPPSAAIIVVFLFSVFVGIILQLSSEMFRPHVALIMYVAGKSPMELNNPAAISAAAAAITDSEESAEKNTPIKRPQFVSEELNSKWLSLGLVSIPTGVEAVSSQVKAISMTWGGEMAKLFVHTSLEVQYGTSKVEVVYVNRKTTYAELILETIKSVDNATLSNEYKWTIWCHYKMYVNTEILRKMLLAMDASFPVVASITYSSKRLTVPPIIAMSFPAISILSSKLDWVFWSSDSNNIEIQPHRLQVMGVKYVNLQDINSKIQPPAKKLLLEVTDKMLIEELRSINGLSESLTIGPIEDPNLMFKLGYYLYEEMYIELEKRLDDIVKYHNEMQNKVPARLSSHEVWPDGINPPFKPSTAEANIPWDKYDYNSNAETSSTLQKPSQKVKRVEKKAIQNMLTSTRENCAIHLSNSSNASTLQVKEIKKRFSPGYGYEYRMIFSGTMMSSDGNTVDDTYLMRTAIPLGTSIHEMIKEIKSPHLDIILPLSMLDEKLKQFINNYENVCLKQKLPLGITVSLHIVMFQMFNVNELKKIVHDYVTTYPNANITMQEADHAVDLQQAVFHKASAMDENPLLWFTNTSFQFSAEFIQQCAMFPWKQKIFFPIPRNSEGTRWELDSYMNMCGYGNDITVASRYVETLVDEQGDLSYDIFDWFIKHQSIELIRSPAPELLNINPSAITTRENNKLLTI